MIILGVDPGFKFSGFGILKTEGRASCLIDHGFLALPQTKSLSFRIGMFYDFFSEKVTQWKVTDLSLETPYLGKNAQNFLKLGYLRGNLYLIAEKNKLNLHEYSPPEVKQAVTGFGGAKKDQVARIILQLFPGMKLPEKHDVTDALAVTLCGLWRKKTL